MENPDSVKLWQVSPEGSASAATRTYKHLETTANDKTMILCQKTRRQQLSEEEMVILRVFYWCAYFGEAFKSYLTTMVRDLRWSPFLKSFKNRSVISGAVWGEHTEVIRYLLGDY